MSNLNKKGFSPILPIILLAGSGTVVLILSSLFSPSQLDDQQTSVREDDVDIIGGIDLTTETEENIIKLIEGVGDFEGGVPGLESVPGSDGNISGIDGNNLGFDKSVGDFNIKTGGTFEFNNPFYSRSSDIFDSSLATDTLVERQLKEAPDIPFSTVNITPISTEIQDDFSLSPFVSRGEVFFNELENNQSELEGNISKSLGESLLTTIGVTFLICFAASELLALFPSLSSVSTKDNLGGVKECGFDSISRGLGKAVLYRIVKEYISWASGGFQSGSPKFLAEPEEFAESFVNDEIGRALDVHGFGFLCNGGLRIDLPINLRYRALDIEAPECTLDDYKRNIETFKRDPLKISVNVEREKIKVFKEQLFGERITKIENQTKKLDAELRKLNDLEVEVNVFKELGERDRIIEKKEEEAKMRVNVPPIVDGDIAAGYQRVCENGKCRLVTKHVAKSLEKETDNQNKSFLDRVNNADEFLEIIGIATEATIVGVIKNLATSLKKDGGVSAYKEISKRESVDSSPFNSIAAEIWVNVFSESPTFISFMRRNVELSDVSYTLGYLSSRLQGISQTANLRTSAFNLLEKNVANTRGLLLTEINLLPGKNKDDSLRSYVSDLIPYNNKSGILAFINTLSNNEKAVYSSLEKIFNGLDEDNQYIEVPEDINNLISLITKSEPVYRKHIEDINIIFNTFIATTEYYNSKKFENYPQIVNDFKNGNAKVYVKKVNSNSIKTSLSNLIAFQTIENLISQTNSDFRCSNVKYDNVNEIPNYIDTGCSIFDLYYITEKILDSYDLTTDGPVITIDNSIIVKLIYELDLVFKNTRYPAIIPRISTPEEQSRPGYDYNSDLARIDIFRKVFNKQPIDSTDVLFKNTFITKDNEKNPLDTDFLTYTPDEAARTYKLNLQEKVVVWRNNYITSFES